jgi:hypothetical protein
VSSVNDDRLGVAEVGRVDGVVNTSVELADQASASQ